MAIGYCRHAFVDDTRPNWDGTGPRPISWSAWYPTDATEGPLPPPGPFEMGAVVQDAPLADRAPFPTVLLSHGTGGTAISLGWIARALAATGRVVLAPNHHGNTGAEPYHPAGFLCWWERATDLSRLLSHLATAGPFAGRLNLTQVDAVGFSLGAYTVLALAGARSSMDRFLDWAQSKNIDLSGPPEFPDLMAHVPTLAATSTPYRDAMARQGAEYFDDRIGHVVAIAAPPPVRAFSAESVAALTRPVTLLTGGADREAPFAHCSDWLIRKNPGFRHQSLGPEVGHYTFLEFPTDRRLIGQEGIFTDHPTVDRALVHQTTARLITRALAR